MSEKKLPKLTQKQKKYIEYRAQGYNQTDAYQKAGYGENSTRKTLKENACRQEAKEAIRAHMNALDAITETGALQSIEQRKSALIELYQQSSNEKTRLKALELLSRMSGDYIDRKDVSISGISREDRTQAMQDALTALMDVWNE